MAQFLSSEWLDDLETTLNGHEGFTSSISGTDLSLQFVVPDAPEGAEGEYHLVIGGGKATTGVGAAESPDATITNDYATATQIFKGELNTQMAFMTGKLKVAGNMAKIMQNQAVLGQFANAAAEVDVDF